MDLSCYGTTTMGAAQSLWSIFFKAVFNNWNLTYTFYNFIYSHVFSSYLVIDFISYYAQFYDCLLCKAHKNVLS